MLLLLLLLLIILSFLLAFAAVSHFFAHPNCPPAQNQLLGLPSYRLSDNPSYDFAFRSSFDPTLQSKHRSLRMDGLSPESAAASAKRRSVSVSQAASL